MVNLFLFYKDHVVYNLMEKFKYSSVMEVPKIVKITINMGVGKSILNKNFLEKSVEDLTLISGQKPVLTKARKSIANFKIRQGQVVGCKVTLRGSRMWEFFEKLISIAVPRIRDFRGLSKKSFDGRGNYSFGIREQIIFPEINYESVDSIRGMDVIITTSAKFDQEAYILLDTLRFPFRK